jgi:hypothetical protein
MGLHLSPPLCIETAPIWLLDELEFCSGWSKQMSLASDTFLHRLHLVEKLDNENAYNLSHSHAFIWNL